MRVALDVSPAVVGISGVARYTRKLWQQLLGFEGLEVYAFGAGRGRRLPFQARQLPVPLRIMHGAWRVLRWPTVEAIVGPVDVVHSVDMVPPPTTRPLVITIHDALSVTHPQFLSPRAIKAQTLQLAAAQKANVVVTTCEATAALLPTVGVPRQRVVVAPLGPRSDMRGALPSHFRPPYILAVGAVTPRKGYETLAAAIALLGPLSPPVLIAGPDGWYAERVRAAVKATDKHDRIRFIGDVRDDVLAALYREATVFCHPSLAEGFGIACLEAMGFGRAIVAADIPSVREVTGGTAKLVPPNDAATFAAELSALLDDEALRNHLGSRAGTESTKYSWRQMAGSVVNAYDEALSTASSR